MTTMRRAALLVVALSLIAVIFAQRPEPAQACASEAPCDSGAIAVECPPDGASDAHYVTFNIPKDARDVTYRIVDATTGQEYSSMSSICSGTTMSVSSTRTPGATEDTFTVDYTINNMSGGGDPNEQHPVKVIAEWNRETDLGIKKELFGLQDNEIGTDDEVTFLITVTNHGPAPLAGETFVFDAASKLGQPEGIHGCKILRVRQLEGPAVTGLNTLPPTKGVVDAFFHRLEVGDSIVIAVTCKPTEGPGEYLNRATTFFKSSEIRVEPVPDPHPNSVLVPFTVKPVSDSKIKKAGAAQVSGTASDPPAASDRRAGPARARLSVKAVDVAILRLSRGLDGFEGQLAGRAARRGAKCEWVKNASGATKRAPANRGVCDEPVWLDAKGSERWTFRLKQDLPEGKYVVYSRAIGSDGLAESNFTKADDNLYRFKVR